MPEFVKRRPGAPRGFFAAEAAGLRWLAQVDGGAPCAKVLGVDESSLTLARLESVPPSRDAAREFGRRLAITHGGGAPGFGAGPDGWVGAGFFGPMANPLPVTLTVHESWGQFYARERLAPFAEMAGERLGSEACEIVSDVAEACSAGKFDNTDCPARLHGDLWSGNVMWTPDGAVMIDPAAHGGHPEADLAMLALFGCPFFGDVVAGYQEVKTLAAGWQDRLGLHQLFPLLAHVVLFGQTYAGQAEAAARSAHRL